MGPLRRKQREEKMEVIDKEEVDSEREDTESERERTKEK